MDRGAIRISGMFTGRTYTVPLTAKGINKLAIDDQKRLESVRFCDGLLMLNNGCFSGAGIRRLTLPSSVRSIGIDAFCSCASLRFADLSTASGLARLDDRTFYGCGMLKTVLLGDGLEAIGCECFSGSGLEAITIPKGVQRIGDCAFFRCVSLKQISFAGEVLESIG